MAIRNTAIVVGHSLHLSWSILFSANHLPGRLQLTDRGYLENPVAEARHCKPAVGNDKVMSYLTLHGLQRAFALDGLKPDIFG